MYVNHEAGAGLQELGDPRPL